MIYRIPLNCLSSLCKREAGRDFWEGRFKPRNCYDFYSFLSNVGPARIANANGGSEAEFS